MKLQRERAKELIKAISEEKCRNTRFHALLYKGELLSHFSMIWSYDSRLGEITHFSGSEKINLQKDKIIISPEKAPNKLKLRYLCSRINIKL